MKSATDSKVTTVAQVNIELGSFKSLASDPTSLPSATSTIVVGVMLAVALVSRAAQ